MRMGSQGELSVEGLREELDKALFSARRLELECEDLRELVRSLTGASYSPSVLVELSPVVVKPDEDVVESAENILSIIASPSATTSDLLVAKEWLRSALDGLE